MSELEEEERLTSRMFVWLWRTTGRLEMRKLGRQGEGGGGGSSGLGLSAMPVDDALDAVDCKDRTGKKANNLSDRSSYRDNISEAKTFTYASSASKQHSQSYLPPPISPRGLPPERSDPSAPPSAR
jgi:hypothetical protein